MLPNIGMAYTGVLVQASTLAFCVYNLARYPACQDKLAAEARAQPGASQHLPALLPALYDDHFCGKLTARFPCGMLGAVSLLT